MVFYEAQAISANVSTAPPDHCAAGLHYQSCSPILIVSPLLARASVVHHVSEHAGHQLSSSREVHDASVQRKPRKRKKS